MLFRKFVEANRLAVAPDFSGRGGKKYRGIGGDKTREELMRTVAFAGFVDGCEGRPHRHKGPHGSVDGFTPPRTQSPEPDDIVHSMFGKMVETYPDEAVRELARDTVRHYDYVRRPEAQIYDEQYRLGRVMSER